MKTNFFYKLPLLQTTYEDPVAAARNVRQAFAFLGVMALVLLFIGINIVPRIRLPRLTSTQQYKYFNIACICMALVAGFFKLFPLSLAALTLLGFGALSKLFEKQSSETEPAEIFSASTTENVPLVYTGRNLIFSDDIIHFVLGKYLPFFSTLTEKEKDKFLFRLKDFISNKTFEIQDTSGYREMPVLVSAAAIQLSFGLSQYLLPAFPVIRIYPAEFMRTAPAICFLVGNVSNNCINISWKHFLEGFAYPENGENVGLHEMAHALYYQNFEALRNHDNSFIENYPTAGECCSRVMMKEKAKRELYSEYGLTNEQEFWAETIELFFERSAAMQQEYPELYTAVTKLMNQDPAIKYVTS